MPDPLLATNRVFLRTFSVGDEPLIVNLDQDPNVRRHLDQPHPTTLAEARNILAGFRAYSLQGHPHGFWAAHLSTAPELEVEQPFIGWFHFRPDREFPEAMELGFRILPQYWGQGLATEVSKALVKRGFEEWNVKCVSGRTAKENVASLRVMEKIGLTVSSEYLHEGRLPSIRLSLNATDYAL